MLRVRPWLVMLVVAGSCRCLQAPPTTFEDQPFVVTPTELDFGEPFVGQRVTRLLSVRNATIRPRGLDASVPAPFEGAFPEVIPAVESSDVPISLTVERAESLTRTFDVDGTEVSLRVRSRPAPVCAPSAACRDPFFDPSTGSCQEHLTSDGVSCTTSCLSLGRCVAGECIGQSQSCDDGNQCTVDACGASGCVHSAIACPSALPCQAARCDPSLGCVTDPVVDGVSCGVDDCARNLAFVCVNGACVSRQRPQGTLCVETLAGVPGGPGHVDGTRDTVRFDQLLVGATDAWGTTWLVSRYSVRKLTAGGVVSTLLRRGVLEQFLPETATTDAWGNLYFDEGRCVRKVTPLGVTTRLGASCSLLGSTSIESILVQRDGRTLIAWEGAIFELDQAGLLRRVRAGRGPLQETAADELLFVNVEDGGAMLSVLGRDGGVTALRPWRGHLLRDPRSSPAPSVSPRGQALSVREPDGGCELTIEAEDGVTRVRRALDRSCYLAKASLSQRFGGWIGRDESVWFLDQSLQLSRLTDAGVERVLGFVERPGDADGRGSDAGLRVSGERPSLDLLAERTPGVVTIVDADRFLGSRLREWRDDGGLVTLVTLTDGGTNFSLTALQPSDGGLWMLGRTEGLPGWTWWNGVGEPTWGPARFPAYAPFSAVGAVLDDDGTWLYGGELVRYDAQLRLVGVVVGALNSTVFFRDGPLPPFLPDAGPSVPSMTDALFGRLSSAAPLGDGRIAFATEHSVRLLVDGGLVTLAGQRDAGFFDGVGALAAFAEPRGIAWSASKQLLFVADRDNFAIRTVDLSGQVRTVARLSDRPIALTVTASGDVYILVRHALLRAR